jgi:putative transposase
MGNEYRKASHSVFRLEVHVVWATKYRYKVLKGEIATRAREYIRRIANEERAEILSGTLSPDHVHLVLSLDPSTSIAHIVKFLKGKTSRRLQMEFPELRKRYWGQHLWARGYFAVSVGNVTKDMVAAYLEHHFEGKEGTDSFRIDEGH